LERQAAQNHSLNNNHNIRGGLSCLTTQITRTAKAVRREIRIPEISRTTRSVLLRPVAKVASIATADVKVKFSPVTSGPVKARMFFVEYQMMRR
jgi:hypothetical protein